MFFFKDLKFRPCLTRNPTAFSRCHAALFYFHAVVLHIEPFRSKSSYLSSFAFLYPNPLPADKYFFSVQHCQFPPPFLFPDMTFLLCFSLSLMNIFYVRIIRIFLTFGMLRNIA